jgi:hypothetical protein
MGLSGAEFEQMVGGVRYADLANNQAFFAAAQGGPSPFAKAIDRANQIWGREGLIKTPIPAAKVDGSAIVRSLKP